jgi:hypothetical protein
MVETVSRAIVVRVHLIIQITHWRQENFEQTGELAQQNDRAIHHDNKQVTLEEWRSSVHEKTRLAFRGWLIDKQLNRNWSLAI